MVPTDDITITYKVKSLNATKKSDEDAKKLADVISSHSSYLADSVKKPVVPVPGPSSLPLIIEEEMEVT